MRRLVTAVVFLDSASSKEFAHMSLYAGAEIFKKFFIFLLHFRYDELPFYQKWIDQNDRNQHVKQKQK